MVQVRSILFVCFVFDYVVPRTVLVFFCLLIFFFSSLVQGVSIRLDVGGVGFRQRRWVGRVERRDGMDADVDHHDVGAAAVEHDIVGARHGTVLRETVRRGD